MHGRISSAFPFRSFVPYSGSVMKGLPMQTKSACPLTRIFSPYLGNVFGDHDWNLHGLLDALGHVNPGTTGEAMVWS